MTDPVISLSGRHAVVTGGARGIGAAVADRLNALGARLTLMGRDEEALRARCAALGDARPVHVDVTDEQAVERAFAAAVALHGPVDILINNAGAAASAPLRATERQMWDHMLAVNLTGAFLCARAVVGAMTERGWGRIVTIASTAGLKGYAYVAAYCAAKHGVIGMTRALALETARRGVTVNAVCPGYTETELLEGAIANIMHKTGCSREQAQAQLRRVNPQDRFVEPAEVAAAVAWLCQPGSESITGQAIAVAGGEVM
jgi:NAD(P)-dependent dehydrogenase (short-subunit alcohol dehydrogenase family)